MAEGVAIGLAPTLVVSNGKAAIDFYKNAFGAEEVNCHMAPDSDKVMHAQLKVLGSDLMLSDDFPEYMGGKSRTAEALGGSPVILHLQVEDAEATWAQAVGAGAKVAMPLKEQFWGDKYGRLLDPFGLEWSIGQKVRMVSYEETELAAKAFFK